MIQWFFSCLGKSSSGSIEIIDSNLSNSAVDQIITVQSNNNENNKQEQLELYTEQNEEQIKKQQQQDQNHQEIKQEDNKQQPQKQQDIDLQNLINISKFLTRF